MLQLAGALLDALQRLGGHVLDAVPGIDGDVGHGRGAGLGGVHHVAGHARDVLGARLDGVPGGRARGLGALDRVVDAVLHGGIGGHRRAADVGDAGLDRLADVLAGVLDRAQGLLAERDGGAGALGDRVAHAQDGGADGAVFLLVRLELARLDLLVDRGIRRDDRAGGGCDGRHGRTPGFG